jgi:hypothetical protein
MRALLRFEEVRWGFSNVLIEENVLLKMTNQITQTSEGKGNKPQKTCFCLNGHGLLYQSPYQNTAGEPMMYALLRTQHMQKQT